ncbi:YscB family type III secretion system chaperone [Aeromonas piscicola]|jgi:type III secretion protein B|uniref:YscB family type III secretion system chaperone n=1 Tax=Aeromonas piscicola TaxID=600645 RepID=A0ABT7Q8F5_9GAMM|nr:YscB family type III secretion system chaperone [Aeromonas piscicola]MDM5130224.1 YscB family type III secretion system chaperone [Aeromonas piscicola]
MQTLLNRLAATLGQGPFVADAQGKYHLRLDGYPLFLTQRSGELLLSTPLAGSGTNAAATDDPVLLKRLLQQVVAWGRHAPHALVLDELGNLQLEARLALEWLDEQLLAERLSQHIALLEQLEPQLTEAALAPQWRQMIWHP